MKTARSTGYSTAEQGICFRILITIIILCLLPGMLEAQQKPSRQSSLEAYSKGNYELAYSEFSELLVSYPKDPLYKYYSGVCLVRLKRDPARAVHLLKEAQQTVAVVRNIPADVLFWLGRAQQLSGLFSEAIESYNSYTNQGGKKSAKEMGVPEFIEECRAGKGKLEQAEKVTVKKQVVKDTAVIGPVASQGTERQQISADYDMLLSKAMRYQKMSDSVQKTIDIKNEGIEKLSYRERTEIKSQLTRTRNIADSLQNLADSLFSVAQEVMNKTPFVSAPAAKDTVQKLPVSIMPDTTIKRPVNKSMPEKEADPAVPETNNKPEAPRVKPVIKDTLKPSVAKVVPAQVKSQVPVYIYFKINPKPVYEPDDKIEINPKIPPGLIYRIQTAVFKNPVAPSYFKGISPVYGFKSTSSGLTVYYSGMFRRLADANKALAAVRQKGFKDAFVTSFFEGKTVSAERAGVLEKEWGKKPFPSAAPETSVAQADTIPPTLVYRVEVMRSEKPVKDDVIEGINKMAGARGTETVRMEDGSQVFLIGMFITYESAAEYADLLIRNGYREAKVTAWLGKKEIPVETARELFDKLK